MCVLGIFYNNIITTTAILTKKRPEFGGYSGRKRRITLQRYKKKADFAICLPLASAHLEAMLATKIVQPSHKGTNFLQSCKYHLILPSVFIS